METVTWSEVSYAEAPMKLGIALKECSRRDSLSSSTGDSGYISDVEMGLSPLEVGSPWQVPRTSSDFTCDSSALFDVKEVAYSNTKRSATAGIHPMQVKRYKFEQEVVSTPRIEITSNPQNQSAAAPPSARRASRNDNIELWVNDNLHPQACPKERNLSIVSLDSTASCSMYSHTDDNSDDEHTPHPSPNLSKAALTTINLIMRKIELNLTHAAYTQCAGTHTSRTQNTSASTTSTTSSSSSRLRPSHTSHSKRKSSTLPPSDPPSDSDSSSPKRRRPSFATTTSTSTSSDSPPRFACPFYQHSPTRYRHRRTCAGPGWPTVHRMKEHLYRSHAQPIFCPRCYAMFDSDADFSAHIRGAEPCVTSAPQPVEGIDRKTVEGLKKRCRGERMEEDKWRDVYRVLFPGVGEGEVPSPYYTTHPPNSSSRHFRRALLARVRAELLAEAEAEPGPVEQTLLRRVATIVRRCEQDLLDTFCAPQEDLPVSEEARDRWRGEAVEAPATQHAVVSAPASASAPVHPNLGPGSGPGIVSQQGPAEESVDAGVGASASTRGERFVAAGEEGFAGWEDAPFELIDWDVAFPPGVVDGGVTQVEGAYAVEGGVGWMV